MAGDIGNRGSIALAAGAGLDHGCHKPSLKGKCKIGAGKACLARKGVLQPGKRRFWQDVKIGLIV
jgi:hypothetical protein